VRYQFIHDQERRYRVTALCAALAVSRSGYYDWKARPESRRARRNRVARLRRLHGIEARRRRRLRTGQAARNSAPSAPNLLNRQFHVGAADRLWAGDITFIPTREGWLYLAILLDLYSRRVVGWAMGEKQNRQLAIDALVMAIEHRQPKPVSSITPIKACCMPLPRTGRSSRPIT
jgi:putative transposase